MNSKLFSVRFENSLSTRSKPIKLELNVFCSVNINLRDLRIIYSTRISVNSHNLLFSSYHSHASFSDHNVQFQHYPKGQRDSIISFSDLKSMIWTLFSVIYARNLTSTRSHPFKLELNVFWSININLSRLKTINKFSKCIVRL